MNKERKKESCIAHVSIDVRPDHLSGGSSNPSTAHTLPSGTLLRVSTDGGLVIRNWRIEKKIIPINYEHYSSCAFISSDMVRTFRNCNVHFFLTSTSIVCTVNGIRGYYTLAQSIVRSFVFTRRRRGEEKEANHPFIRSLCLCLSVSVVSTLI